MNSDFCVAVHALVYLNRRGCVLSSEELARNICTNPARVRKVLARMKKDGLVETKEGSSGGGYRFAKGAWPGWRRSQWNRWTGSSPADPAPAADDPAAENSANGGFLWGLIWRSAFRR